MRLFIDDERFPPDDGNEWFIARSYKDAVAWMTNHRITYISIDHDLGDGVPTGADIVNWMIEHDLDTGGRFIPENFQFYVHSQNPVGKENIISKLEGYLPFRG